MSWLDGWTAHLFGARAPFRRVLLAPAVAATSEDVVAAEDFVLADLAVLTQVHGPWEAASLKFNIISEGELSVLSAGDGAGVKVAPGVSDAAESASGASGVPA